jgi:hypothetical protein
MLQDENDPKHLGEICCNYFLSWWSKFTCGLFRWHIDRRQVIGCYRKGQQNTWQGRCMRDEVGGARKLCSGCGKMWRLKERTGIHSHLGNGKSEGPRRAKMMGSCGQVVTNGTSCHRIQIWAWRLPHAERARWLT